MPISRWALISFASSLGAVSFFLFGRAEGSRMIASGQGFEMAFYWSPLVYFVVKALLAIAAVAAVVGVVWGPETPRRIQAALALLVGAVGLFAVLHG
jgi:hypothetical protein